MSEIRRDRIQGRVERLIRDLMANVVEFKMRRATHKDLAEYTSDSKLLQSLKNWLKREKKIDEYKENVSK